MLSIWKPAFRSIPCVFTFFLFGALIYRHFCFKCLCILLCIGRRSMFSDEHSRYQFVLVPKCMTNNDVFKKKHMASEQKMYPLGTRRDCLGKTHFYHESTLVLNATRIVFNALKLPKCQGMWYFSLFYPTSLLLLKDVCTHIHGREHLTYETPFVCLARHGTEYSRGSCVCLIQLASSPGKRFHMFMVSMYIVIEWIRLDFARGVKCKRCGESGHDS